MTAGHRTFHRHSACAATDNFPTLYSGPAKQGLTLRGTGGEPDGVDRLLVLDRTLMLLASEFALCTLVANDHASSLARLPGYDKLRRAWQPPADTALDASTIDLVAGSMVLSQPVGT